MMNRAADPRTEDTIVYELMRTQGADGATESVGRAVFRGGRSTIEAPESVAAAVEELLAQAFVDRVRADERPRGYRRSHGGLVDMLVPGMAEHFIARMRGLWLSYPDGSVVTAREAHTARGSGSALGIARPERGEAGAPITDPAVRRSTLAAAESVLGARPLVREHPPEVGLRPEVEGRWDRPVSRTDCGWVV